MRFFKRLWLLWRLRKPPVSKHPAEKLEEAVLYYLEHCPEPNVDELAETLRYTVDQLLGVLSWKVRRRLSSLSADSHTPKWVNPHHITLEQISWVSH